MGLSKSSVQEDLFPTLIPVLDLVQRRADHPGLCSSQMELAAAQAGSEQRGRQVGNTPGHREPGGLGGGPPLSSANDHSTRLLVPMWLLQSKLQSQWT